MKENSQTLSHHRILILFPHMVTPGGALNYTLRLAEELRTRGASVAILAMRADVHVCQMPAGVEVIALNGPLTSSLGYWMLFPYWQIKINSCIDSWRPDILVPHVFPSNWWSWLYQSRSRLAKVVWVCHEPSAFIHSEELIDGLRPFWKRWVAKCLRPLLQRIDIRLAKKADRIVANSSYTAEQFRRVYGKESDGVARPGVDSQTFFPSTSPREQAMITAAHLVPYKRVDFLLEVFSHLKAHFPNLVFDVVGEGPESRRLQVLTRALGIADSVRFYGRINQQELATLYRRALLFWSASVNETFGMAPLEAIACGTPVAVHCSGGPLEYMTEGCGRLIASLQVEDWVREISVYLDRLLADDAFPKRVQECAQRFDWQNSLHPALEIIGGLCTEGAKTSLNLVTTEPSHS